MRLLNARRLLGVAVLAPLAALAIAAAQQAPDSDPAAPDQDWPRQLDSPSGALVVYEPQPDSLQGPTLTARAAFSLTPPGKTEPVFGALWFTANVNTDRDQRVVQVISGKVTKLELPDSPPETQSALSSLVEQELPKISFSLDSLTAALADGQQEQSAAPELRADPPKILFATEPTVLVLLDGQPIQRPIEKSGVDAVVNTPFPLFYMAQSKLYYLTNGAVWYQTADVLNGPWAIIPAPPPAVSQVVAKGDKKDQGTPPAADGPPPRIVVATEPTELVVTKGVPSFAPVNGTQLLQVTNADESIFRDIGSQQIFMVLSGRWYVSRSFDGPWKFIASDQLPPEFAKIPPASSAGNVLAFVSGTPEANQAVVDSEIPQTAEVKRDAPPPPINYDGQPNFQPVTGAAPGVSYAVNSPNSVLNVNGTYYSVVNAVWYMAPGPQGPWSVATAVPQEVQTIPPASPVYNVRYVTIYQATPTVVYTGYTPGYLGCYRWHGTVVYGTGYVYRPYVSSVVYYPRPVTWGFNVAYNPYTGWSYGVGPSAVFLAYGSSWGGAYYRPPWRPVYGGGWYGPGGYRPPPARYPGGWYSPGYRTAYYHPGNAYYGGRPGYGGAYARPAVGLYHRPEYAHAFVARPPYHPVAMGRPAPAAARDMHVVADRNGHVLRQTPNGGWQQHDNRAGWKPAAAPGPGVRPAGYAGSPARGPTPGGPGSPGAPRPGTPGAPSGTRPTTPSANAPHPGNAVPPGGPRPNTQPANSPRPGNAVPPGGTRPNTPSANTPSANAPHPGNAVPPGGTRPPSNTQQPGNAVPPGGTRPSGQPPGGASHPSVPGAQQPPGSAPHNNASGGNKGGGPPGGQKAPQTHAAPQGGHSQPQHTPPPKKKE
jgi:hypothetical protein